MLKEKRRSQINDLSFHFKKPEKYEQIKLKATRRNKLIQIQAEINELELRRIIENPQNPKLVLKVSIFGKPLARLIKKRR